MIIGFLFDSKLFAIKSYFFFFFFVLIFFPFFNLSRRYFMCFASATKLKAIANSITAQPGSSWLGWLCVCALACQVSNTKNNMKQKISASEANQKEEDMQTIGKRKKRKNDEPEFSRTTGRFLLCSHIWFMKSFSKIHLSPLPILYTLWLWQWLVNMNTAGDGMMICVHDKRKIHKTHFFYVWE